uniref:Cell death-inducing p53-target protein 1 n=1 Tax=Cyanistes caeruleus TaxID=156563 RepID=A0A8C0UJH3_CYACU
MRAASHCRFGSQNSQTHPVAAPRCAGFGSPCQAPLVSLHGAFGSQKLFALTCFSLFFFAGGYEYPSPPPYSYRESVTIEQPGEPGAALLPWLCSCSPAEPPGSVYLVPQPPIIVAGIFSSKPTSTICPSCRQHITTQVTYRLGRLSYLLCTSLCMVGCCFGCCFVPLFVKLFKDADHYCPCCQFHIYRYKRL